MISDERKQALIECSFYQAESVNELRWIIGVFHTVIDSLDLRSRFLLSAAQERKLAEFHNAEDGIEVGLSAGDAEITEAPESGGEALRTDPARDERPAAPELPGDRGYAGTGAVGDG